jgi:hypothetical protein
MKLNRFEPTLSKKDIESSKMRLEERNEFIENLHIADCENCQRCTLPSEQYPRGICMAFNQSPGFAHGRCLKSGSVCYKPKIIFISKSE